MCGPVVARAEHGPLRVDPEPSGLTEVLVGGDDEGALDLGLVGNGDTEIHDEWDARAHVGALGPDVQGEGLLGPTHLEVGPANDVACAVGNRYPQSTGRWQIVSDPHPSLIRLAHGDGELSILLVDDADVGALGHIAHLQHGAGLERDDLAARGLAQRLALCLEDHRLGRLRRHRRLDPESHRIGCCSNAVSSHCTQCHGVGLPHLDAGNRHGASRHGRIEADPLSTLVRPLVVGDRLGGRRGREGDGDGASTGRRHQSGGRRHAGVDRWLCRQVIGGHADRGGRRRRGRGLRERRGLHEAGRESRGYGDDREAGGSHGSSRGYGSFCVHSIMGD